MHDDNIELIFSRRDDNASLFLHTCAVLNFVPTLWHTHEVRRFQLLEHIHKLALSAADNITIKEYWVMIRAHPVNEIGRASCRERV